MPECARYYGRNGIDTHFYRTSLYVILFVYAASLSALPTERQCTAEKQYPRSSLLQVLLLRSALVLGKKRTQQVNNKRSIVPTILRFTLCPDAADAMRYPSQARSVVVARDTLPTRRCAPFSRSCDTHTALDWLPLTMTRSIRRTRT